GRYLFRGTLQPRQGMPPLLALLVTRPTANNAPGPTPWQLLGKWLPQEQK
ncbi:type II secretion system protein N, partial [Klebsiella pneumoniae]